MRIVDVEQIGLDDRPAATPAQLAEAGIEIKALLAEQVSVQHPELAGLDEIAYVMFRGREPDGAVRTCTTLKPGRVDRSPCGTGSSANLAVLHARGEVRVGDVRRSRSIIGGDFLAEVDRRDDGRRPAGGAAPDHRPGLDLRPRALRRRRRTIRSRRASRSPTPGDRRSIFWAAG